MPPTLLTPESLRETYDRRYEGDYMAGDRFAQWSHEGVERSRVIDTLDQVPREGIANVLDYGCGQGEWADTLREVFPGARVAGIDISPVAIQKAADRRSGLEFQTFDGGRAPFPDGSFDLVYSYHVLEHVLDLNAVINDMVRLVRPGGYLCVICPCGNPGSFEERVVLKVRGGIVTGANGETKFFYEDPTHLRRLLSAQVFELFAARGAHRVAAFYAHQALGAIEWIAKSGRSFVNELFSARPQASAGSALWLRAMHALLFLLAALCDVAAAVPGKKGSSFSRRVLLRVLWPVRQIGHLNSSILTSLARLEWRYRRYAENGSAQFLILRKTPSP